MMLKYSCIDDAPIFPQRLPESPMKTSVDGEAILNIELSKDIIKSHLF